jgi:hypothetical protein
LLIFSAATGPTLGRRQSRRERATCVERVVHEAQVREDVLHVREVEELVAAGDDERHAHGVELHLQFQRLVVRAVEHVHVLQRVPFVVQLHDLPDHQLGLLRGVADREDRGLRAAGAHGLEAAVEAFDARAVAEDLVGEGQDLRGRAVVGVDRVDQRAGVALGERDDVLPVRAAPGVDALGVVADGHDLVLAGEQVDDAALQAVGVLELVHEDVLEALAVVGERRRVVFEHMQPETEQVIEVAEVAFLLRGVVGRAELHQFLRSALHPFEAFREDVLQGAERVAGVRVGVEDDGRLGVRLVLDEGAVDRLHDLGEELLGFLLVQDGEVGRAGGDGRVAAEDALTDGVERAAQNWPRGDAGEVFDALEHLLGRLVREGQQEDVPRLGALVQQPGHAVGEGAGLAEPAPASTSAGPRGEVTAANCSSLSSARKSTEAGLPRVNGGSLAAIHQAELGDLLVGAVGGADQRSGFDVLDADLEGEGFPLGELVRVHPAVDRGMFLARESTARWSGCRRRRRRCRG